MYRREDQYQSLRSAIEALQTKKPTKEEIHAGVVEKRRSELVQLGYLKAEIESILTVEFSETLRLDVIKDVARKMFGGGTKESLSDPFKISE